jgi:hypothetical protein
MVPTVELATFGLPPWGVILLVWGSVATATFLLVQALKVAARRAWGPTWGDGVFTVAPMLIGALLGWISALVLMIHGFWGVLWGITAGGFSSFLVSTFKGWARSRMEAANVEVGPPPPAPPVVYLPDDEDAGGGA